MATMKFGPAGLLAVAVVVDDQVTKAAAMHAGSVVRNPDYAFGIVGGTPPLLVAGTAIMLAVLVGVLVPLALRLGVSLLIPAVIIGGMLGNVLDRVRYGSVRDFLVTPWAIVNVADIAVTIGMILFVASVAWQLHKTVRSPILHRVE